MSSWRVLGCWAALAASACGSTDRGSGPPEGDGGREAGMSGGSPAETIGGAGAEAGNGGEAEAEKGGAGGDDANCFGVSETEPELSSKHPFPPERVLHRRVEVDGSWASLGS
jgi:hypothetical protein